jgi:protein gp37
MGSKSAIAWTQATWNPITGCDPISPGCAHCYARRMANRLQAMGSGRYRHGFQLTLHPEALAEPAKWKRPRMVFVCSMSDLFHESVPEEFIWRILSTIEDLPRHTFQVLTKRAERMEQVLAGRKLPPNLWLGVTAENQATLDARLPHLLRCDAEVRWLSLEPLLGPVEIPIEALVPFVDVDPALRMTPRIHWVVVGAESGPGRRPCEEIWIRDVVELCEGIETPCFVKQVDLGDALSRDPSEWAPSLRIQRYP